MSGSFGNPFGIAGDGEVIDPAVELRSNVSDDGGGFIENPLNASYFTAVEQSAKGIYDPSTQDTFTKATEDKYTKATELVAQVSDDAGGFIENPDDPTYWLAVEQSDKGVIDATKINNLAQADQYAWTQDAVSGFWYKTSASKFTAQNPVLLNSFASLALYLKCEDLTASIGPDFTGVGTPTFTAGKRDNALTLNGSNQYIKVVDNALANFASNDFTIFTWVNFSADQGSSMYSQFDTTGGQANNACHWRYEANVFTFRYTTDGSTITTKTFNGWTYATGWKLLAVSRRGGDLQMSVDAGQIGSDQSMVGVTMYNSTRDIYIGALDNVGTPAKLLAGQMDEIGICNGYGMTLTELAGLKNGLTGAFLV